MSFAQTLVAETLVLAKTHGYVEKIEDELERELQRDFSDPPQEKILRCRRVGDRIFKSKQMLLTVVILCVVDCALVLGELALDLYKVKVTLEDTGSLTRSTETFLSKIAVTHPVVYNKEPSEIYSMLLESTIYWRSSGNATGENNLTYTGQVPCTRTNTQWNSTSIGLQGSDPGSTGTRVPHTNTSVITGTGRNFVQTNSEVEILGKIAHICHYCSIAILSLLMIETILKAICAGKAFFHRKIEVFDAFVVVVSFLMDFSFLVFLPDLDTKDFVFILAILLPWRVIRVVDSLVVSVKDHEHFRLKLVYKRKKKIQGNLRDTEAMLQKFMSQVTALHRLCIVEGVDEWKIDQYLKNDETSVPPTPSKRKFKFKFDEALMHLQGSRGPRCSLPALDFHGIKFSTNSGSKSRLSLPAVANTIKHHISKNLTNRRASLATTGIYSTKQTNGDVRRKKLASEDLGTMHAHAEESDNDDSVVSSHDTSESGDVFSRRVSISESIESDQNTAVTRTDDWDSTEDEKNRLAQIKQYAKRRNSESTLDKAKMSMNFNNFSDIISFKTPCGKTFTKPHKSQTTDNMLLSPDTIHSDVYSDKDQTSNTLESEIVYIDDDNDDNDVKIRMQNCSNDAILENNNVVGTGTEGATLLHCNGTARPCNNPLKFNNADVPIVIVHSDSDT